MDETIADVGRWVGKRLVEIHRIIHKANPDVSGDLELMANLLPHRWLHASASKNNMQPTTFSGSPWLRKFFSAGLDSGSGGG